MDPIPKRSPIGTPISACHQQRASRRNKEGCQAQYHEGLLALTRGTLTQFEEDVTAAPSYDTNVQGVFDVISDVCLANRSSAARKIGIIPAVKFALFEKLQADQEER